MPKGRARRCGTCPRKRHTKVLASTASPAHGRSSWQGRACACAYRPHFVEDRATALLLVSSTQRGSGQRCAAPFVFRFPCILSSNATILESHRSDMRTPEGPCVEQAPGVTLVARPQSVSSGGRAVCQEVACSYAWPTRQRTSSAKWRATSCTLTGIPSLSKPQGNERVGCRLKFNGNVYRVRTSPSAMSAWPRASMGGAVEGIVGQRTTSTSSKSPCHRPLNASRTWCACAYACALYLAPSSNSSRNGPYSL